MTDKIFIVDCYEYDFNSEVYTDYLIACNRAIFLSSECKELGINRDFTIERKVINKKNDGNDDYIEFFSGGTLKKK